jgi:hypothetical protein
VTHEEDLELLPNTLNYRRETYKCSVPSIMTIIDDGRVIQHAQKTRHKHTQFSDEKAGGNKPFGKKLA